MAPKMTTSSYAVLALLDLRPWTGYELTQQARRSLRYAWPKSERLLYSEPKKLVELGYATTRKETTGKRSRNVYEITGEFDIMVIGRFANETEMNREIKSMLGLPGIEGTNTSVVLDAPKESLDVELRAESE